MGKHEIAVLNFKIKNEVIGDFVWSGVNSKENEYFRNKSPGGRLKPALSI